MKKFIFGKRNGIHIIDLQKTAASSSRSLEFVTRARRAGQNVLFVGTKRQAQDAIDEEANRCGMPYVNSAGWAARSRTSRRSAGRSTA